MQEHAKITGDHNKTGDASARDPAHWRHVRNGAVRVHDVRKCAVFGPANSQIPYFFAVTKAFRVGPRSAIASGSSYLD
jgi:hypothetical protein